MKRKLTQIYQLIHIKSLTLSKQNSRNWEEQMF